MKPNAALASIEALLRVIVAAENFKRDGSLPR